jgi:tetratricopeptide (TPR) repeat protein
MPSSASAKAQADDWSRRGSAAVDVRDLATAKKCFLQAIKLDPGDAKRRFHLAIVLEALEEFGAAAEALTEALRLDPQLSEAARRFSSLVRRQPLPEDARLNPLGLRALLRHDVVVWDHVADAVLQYLSGREPLLGILRAGEATGWDAAARGLCLKKTGPLLRDDVFLELLRTGVVRSPDLEHLMTALRRVLTLDVPRERFADRELMEFAVALERQGWLNEYVWMASEEELQRLGELALSVPELLAGDVEQGYRFLLHSLYEPAHRMLGPDIDVAAVSNVRPRALREAVARRVAEQVEEQAHVARLARPGTVQNAAASSGTSHQDGSAPVPRWTRLGLDLREGEFRRIIARYFPAERLAFMDKPFQILVAGCGTGMHAIQVALGYGPAAQVLAVDASAPDLAYASRMARHFGASNLEFVQADIGEIGAHPDFSSRFPIVVCGSILGTADPFESWRALSRCLAPGGMMLVGLNSATAMRSRAALRGDPAYPGAACTVAKLRAFRHALLTRPEGEPGGALKANPDFYTASGFRDLALQADERSVSIPEIATFLEAEGLVFRGFQPGLIFDLLRQQYLDETWPGSLDRWAELEEAVPQLFAGAYRFWCDRRDEPAG